MRTSPITLEFNNNDHLATLLGAHNENIKHIEKKLSVSIADRGNSLSISGEKSAAKDATKLISHLWSKIEQGHDITPSDIDAELRFMRGDDKNLKSHTVIKTQRKTIAARSPNQEKYLSAIQKNEMVFGLGPAGTGKTYLAVAQAVKMYLAGDVERMIFCRPAVEAGEHLGFLPGDMKEKIDPYLRPIYDALQDMLPLEVITKKIEAGEIEIAPLAFMRGRTLSNAFVILDEAQNTTATQMKMLLTRLGESARMVITGDLTQTDLPAGVKSGLRDAVETLGNVDGIVFHHFNSEDVIRHPLVAKIIDAYKKKS